MSVSPSQDKNKDPQETRSFGIEFTYLIYLFGNVFCLMPHFLYLLNGTTDSPQWHREVPVKKTAF